MVKNIDKDMYVCNNNYWEPMDYIIQVVVNMFVNS